MEFKKYKFETEEVYRELLNNNYNTLDTFVELGYVDNYFLVDVLWLEYNEDWKDYEVFVEGNGIHTFLGYNFNNN